MSKDKLAQKVTWLVYIVECADKTLYCGITTDIERRILQHNSGKGAKYIRSFRRPVTLVYTEFAENKSDASKREYQIKRLSRNEKIKLIKSNGNY